MANSNYNDIEIPQEIVDSLDGKETTVSPEQTTEEPST